MAIGYALRTYGWVAGTCLLLPIACKSSLSAKRDAAFAGDVSIGDAFVPTGDAPEADSATRFTAADATADLRRVDLAAQEAAVTYLPRGFLISNPTARDAYISLSLPAGCREKVGSDWQTCSFFPLGCVPACTSDLVGQSCCEQCEAPIPAVLVIPAGGSQLVPWDGNVHARGVGICADCWCDQAIPVTTGTFAATLAIATSYRCMGATCAPRADGVVDNADIVGPFTTCEQSFDVPSASTEVALGVCRSDVADASAPPDACRRPSGSGGI